MGLALLQRYGVTVAACIVTAVLTWVLVRRRHQRRSDVPEISPLALRWL